MAHDIFISYESTDKATAYAVCDALETASIKCWIAPRDVYGDYVKAIIDGIKTSKMMVLILSAKTNNSDQVYREAKTAMERKVPILSLHIENIEPTEELSFLIGTQHRINAGDKPVSQYFQLLISHIRKHIPEPPKEGDTLSPRHMAIAYRCWRDENDDRFKTWDRKFRSRIYRMDLTIEASWAAMNRITRVEYFLHPSWESAGSKSIYVVDRNTVDDQKKVEANFKCKELIWGNFFLYAEVHLDDSKVIPLSSFVRLPEERS